MPSPVEGNESDGAGHTTLEAGGVETPARNRSYKQGPDTITVVPECIAAQNELTINRRTEGMTAPLRRRNGVRLPTLVTEQLQGYSRVSVGRRPLHDPSQSKASSAGPILYRRRPVEEPQSPDFIGRGATGIFPSSISNEMPSRHRSEGSSSFAVTGSGEGDDGIYPLPMDSENDISLHYAGMMRRLDREHRKALHERDKELAQLRERLNEVDTVYRQELRARDFIIDDLHKRLEHIHENMEDKIEKARNQVEDLWESRWKDRDFHLRERMRRIEEETQKTLDRFTAERIEREGGGKTT